MSLQMHGVSAPAGARVGEHLSQPDSIPLCQQCGVRPCKRAFGKQAKQVSKNFGRPRVVDGVAYRWFCSNTCSGQYRGLSSDMRECVLAASRNNVVKAEKRALERIVAACKGLMDESGRVDAKAMVRVLMQEIRRERINTATRKWIRKKREVAA